MILIRLFYFNLSPAKSVSLLFAQREKEEGKEGKKDKSQI
jgi:hypothetical protein